MTTRPDFAYAQARLQARHGALDAPLAWQMLEASRTAAHYLALARSGPMARWVERLDDAHDPHRIERELRARWRDYVNEVASWLPPRWQPAVRWFGTLCDLALIEALQRDPSLVDFAPPVPAPGMPPPRTPGTTALAAPRGPQAGAGEGDIAARWLAEWARRLPGDADDRALLRRPAECLLPRLLGPEHARSAGAETARRTLRRLFRRHAATALAALAHLGLVALDVERLRGGLVMRVLFEGRPEPAAA